MNNKFFIFHIIFIFSLLIFPFSVFAESSAKNDIERCLMSLFSLDWKNAKDLCLTPTDIYMMEIQLNLATKGQEIPLDDFNKTIQPFVARVSYVVVDEYKKDGKTWVNVNFRFPDLKPVFLMLMGNFVASLQRDDFNIQNTLTDMKTVFDTALANPMLDMDDANIQLPVVDTDKGWRIDTSSSDGVSVGKNVTQSVFDTTLTKNTENQKLSDAGNTNTDNLKKKDSKYAIDTFFGSFKNGNYKDGYDVIADTDKNSISYEEYLKKYALTDEKKASWHGFDYSCTLYTSSDVKDIYRCELQRPNASDPTKIIKMYYDVDVIKNRKDWYIDLSSVRKTY